MKKLIAYSSVGHMGFVTLGIFTFTAQGIEGVYVSNVKSWIGLSGAVSMCRCSLR